jgi:Yip1 domain
MNLVARAKAILMTPKQEWAVIDAEPLNNSELVAGYILPLAAISAIARFIGFSIIGVAGFRISMGLGISMAITSFVLSVIGVFVLAWVINALAPTFGAVQSMPQAIKLSAYSMTAAWVAGIFYIFPFLGILALIGALYSLYLFFVGLPVLMKVPADKVVPYAVVIFVACVVVFWIIGMIVGRMTYMM